MEQPGYPLSRLPFISKPSTSFPRRRSLGCVPFFPLRDRTLLLSLDQLDDTLWASCSETIVSELMKHPSLSLGDSTFGQGGHNDVGRTLQIRETFCPDLEPLLCAVLGLSPEALVDAAFEGGGSGNIGTKAQIEQLRRLAELLAERLRWSQWRQEVLEATCCVVVALPGGDGAPLGDAGDRRHGSSLPSIKVPSSLSLALRRLPWLPSTRGTLLAPGKLFLKVSSMEL